MDDKVANSREPSYSWWDIQDENARLPVKEHVSLYELEDMFMESPSAKSSPTSSSTSSAKTSSGTKMASGAIRSLGKAMTAVANQVEKRDEYRDDPHAPRVSVIAFKLLDLVQISEKYDKPVVKKTPRNKNIGRKDSGSSVHSNTQPKPSNGYSHHNVHKPNQVRQPPSTVPNQYQRPTLSTTGPSPPVSAPQPQRPPAQAEPFIDFGAAPTPVAPIRHSNSMPTKLETKTRAEKLKEEYQRKANKSNRVWDDVDQRWVEVDPNATVNKGSSKSQPPGQAAANAPPKKKNIVGISLDTANSVGKSSHVQAAVQSRVKEMKDAQHKALSELREREAKIQKDADEEDEIRKRLEPRIKGWCEEHGKKKQLRALLSSLHLVLWEGSGWKQVSLGDILDERKARRSYLKATLKVHPDKTRDLDAEKRFIAKRVFDALSQAMTEFENSAS